MTAALRTHEGEHCCQRFVSGSNPGIPEGNQSSFLFYAFARVFFARLFSSFPLCVPFLPLSPVLTVEQIVGHAGWSHSDLDMCVARYKIQDYRQTATHSRGFAAAPAQPWASATSSAQRSPMASTVTIGLYSTPPVSLRPERVMVKGEGKGREGKDHLMVTIDGKMPASAMRRRATPCTRRSGATTASGSTRGSPILVVPAGW